MFTQHLKTLFLRDVSSLERELELYPDDASVWKDVAGLPNSAGNLVLHLCGNLQHFIGATLGSTSYQRDREAEFSSRDIPKNVLREEITKTKQALMETFATLKDKDLEQPYPLAIGGVQLSTLLTLLHLSSHLAYHLGQIDCHRRVVTGDKISANAVSFVELASS
jgi:uncharacterized damage-inducible protein DinB